MVPVAFAVAPLSVAVSLIGLPSTTVWVALVVIDGQFVTLTFTGEMKSLSAELNESEDRLFRYAPPKAPQPVPCGNNALKAIDASPKVNGSCWPRPPVSAAARV